MTTKKTLSSLSIRGFKSIQRLEDFSVSNLNVLIGANGAGKSNFVSYFRMLGEIVENRLQIWTKKQGGADRILTYGVKETQRLTSSLRFGINAYEFALEPTSDGGFVFAYEHLFFQGPYFGPKRINLGSGHSESKLKEAFEETQKNDVADYCYSSISSWKVFHFHDTSDTAGVKRPCPLHDNEYLRSDASNLAAFLYKLYETHPSVYQQIRKTVKLAIPFFDDFVLRPVELSSGEKLVTLLWKQTDSDYALWPSQLSDGSIRFICLATALLQNNPPKTIIFDEPELGLHPYAITLLGALVRSASTKMQVIISTQSVPLLNEFSINELIVTEHTSKGSVFKKFDEENFSNWLQDYTVGELWEKNILGGRP